MKRLVLDSGPLIALFSAKDNYHEECKVGFGKLPALFGEVVTPLPVVFEVYKFVARGQSPSAAQKMLALIFEDMLVVPIGIEAFRSIYSMVCQMPNWKGSLEDASVVVIAQQYEASLWTLDYRDLSVFQYLDFWVP